MFVLLIGLQINAQSRTVCEHVKVHTVLPVGNLVTFMNTLSSPPQHIAFPSKLLVYSAVIKRAFFGFNFLSYFYFDHT